MSDGYVVDDGKDLFSRSTSKHNHKLYHEPIIYRRQWISDAKQVENSKGKYMPVLEVVLSCLLTAHNDEDTNTITITPDVGLFIKTIQQL